MATTDTGFNAQIGQQEFLQLLTTQLRYQDPMAPMEQQEFLTQLSQFSMLSGVEKLNTKFSTMLQLQQLTNGSSLMGKEVEYIAGEDGTTATGKVEGVLVHEGTLYLNIDDKAIPLSNILQVKDAATAGS